MDPGLANFCSSKGEDDSQHISGGSTSHSWANQQQQQQQPGGERQQQPHSTIRLGFLSALPHKEEVVRQFTPSWFAVTMGTGSVALSIASFPFHFPGQAEIALAVWALNVLLFMLFSCLLLARAVFYTDTIRHLYHHPNQSLFIGAVPMAFSTITTGVVALLIPRHGLIAAQVAEVLFWVNLPAVVLCIVLIPLSMFTIHTGHSFTTMTALWLFPVVPACVAANTAGAVATHMVDSKVAMSVALIGVSLLAIGFLLAYQIITIYYNRLICHKLPPRETIITSFLPIGPLGMTAMALMNLALAADHHLVAYVHEQNPGSPIDDEWLQRVVQVLVESAAVLALCVWGLSVWWLVLAVSCIAQTLRIGIPFNLGWWGSVFPVGTVAIAACQLAALLPSAGLRYLGAATVAAHVLLWLVVVVLTAQRAWLGQLFHAPCLQAAAASTAVVAVLAGAGDNTGVAAAEVAAVRGSSQTDRGSTGIGITKASGRMSPAASQALADLEDKLQHSSTAKPAAAVSQLA